MPIGKAGALGLLLGLLLLALAPALAGAEVMYGPGENEDITVFPSAVPNSTVVELVHGGNWDSQTLPVMDRPDARDLAEAGYTVFDINYPLAKGLGTRDVTTAFPMEPDAIELATHWVQAHAREYNGDPSNIVLLGGSTGANIATLAAERLDRETPGAISGLIELSGPMDLQTLAEYTTRTAREGEEEIGKASSLYLPLAQAIGCKARELLLFSCEASERAWSPVANIPPACPAMSLFGARQELMPIEQQEEMFDAAQAGGCQVELTVEPAGHSFAYWDRALPVMLAFLAAH
jgi:acetyl esterase/lipase